MKTLLLFFISTLAISAERPFINPGPEGIRFNKMEIYRVEKALERKLSEKDLSAEDLAENEQLKNMLTFGKRAVNWFAYVNSNRPDDRKLDLTTKGESKGVAITDPMKTNTKILWDRQQELLKTINPAIISVVSSTGDLPANPPVSDEEFVAAIKKLDIHYQHVVRWSGSKDSLSWYINRSLWDIRGYYFLKNIPDITEALKTFETLPLDKQQTYSNWLFSLCHNGDFEDSDCRDELNNAIAKKRVSDYYTRFNKYGASQYKSFFTMPTSREELYWNADRTVLYSPFLDPQRKDVSDWLKTNIEEEWQAPGFKLKLDFKMKSEKTIPHIEFASGVTAHVNEVGGDTITMDGDYSLNNYAQRWTIRHEYGHVLGFTDCYLEFYDVNEKAMIYYEIDIDNLMCSRHGNLKPIHIESLRAAYNKN